MTTERSLEIGPDDVEAVSLELRRLLADVFALYLKTKNFHWHTRGAHFRDFHLLLDEHSDQLFAMTDAIAERTRKLGGGGLSLHRLQVLYLEPHLMTSIANITTVPRSL